MTVLLDSPAIVVVKDKDGRAVSAMKVDKIMVHSLGEKGIEYREKTFDGSWCKYGAVRG